MKQAAKELGLSLYLGLLSNIFFLGCSCMYWFIPLQPYEMSTVLEQWALPVKKKKIKKIHALCQLQAGKRPSVIAATFIDMWQSYAVLWLWIIWLAPLMTDLGVDDLKSQHVTMIGKFVWWLVGTASSLQFLPACVTAPNYKRVELASCPDAHGTPILCQVHIPCLQYALIACMIYISTRLHNFRLNLCQNFR